MTARGIWGAQEVESVGKADSSLHFPFLSRGGSKLGQPAACLSAGARVPRLGSPPPPQGQPQLCTLAAPLLLASWPPLATCNWHLLFLETEHSEVRGRESQILSKQGCPLSQQEKRLDWSGEFSLPSAPGTCRNQGWGRMLVEPLAPPPRRIDGQELRYRSSLGWWGGGAVSRAGSGEGVRRAPVALPFGGWLLGRLGEGGVWGAGGGAPALGRRGGARWLQLGSDKRRRRERAGGGAAPRGPQGDTRPRPRPPQPGPPARLLTPSPQPLTPGALSRPPPPGGGWGAARAPPPPAPSPGPAQDARGPRQPPGRP
ncbi:collagen alpha-1(II) chain-like [Diceros bicornis minor]|uniref:collagen alpha-1(II) chain-like n=1 Tax=Diceros bicornis minor TaxID=77932 RepID=UPI0026EC3C98|nr:collagen alpha-1(II) chain-like [Diceros bicornis minor]